MLQKPDKFAPAIYGGFIMGALNGIPFVNIVNCLCCAGILFGGFMAVYFYQKQLTEEMDPMTSGDTVGLGAFAGVFGAIVSVILSGLFLFLLGDVVGDTIREIMQSSPVFNTPEARIQMEQAFQNQSPIMAMMINLISSFIICPLFGLLGGLIGYAVFRKREDKNKPRQA